MTVAEIYAKAMKLGADERKQLMKMLSDTLEQPEQPVKRRSILELRGLGKEIWEGIDAQEYVNQLRSEWDHRE